MSLTRHRDDADNVSHDISDESQLLVNQRTLL
jgi:hypothetical protein